MTDWSSPQTLAKVTAYRNAQSLVLGGLVLWEIITTIEFDWTIVTRQRQWKWPMLMYWIARLSIALHVMALIANGHGQEIINCDAQIWILKITDATGIWASSGLLTLRCIAVWSKDRRIIGILGVLFAGLIVAYCMTWQKSIAIWNDKAKNCIITKTAPNNVLLAEFLYTFVFDLVITLLAMWKLWAWRGQGGISALLVRDGLAYFIVASMGNLVQAILPALNLNPLMNIVFLPVAMAISVIAATRVYANLITAHNTLELRTNHQASEQGAWSGPGNNGNGNNWSVMATRGRANSVAKPKRVTVNIGQTTTVDVEVNQTQSYTSPVTPANNAPTYALKELKGIPYSRDDFEKDIELGLRQDKAQPFENGSDRSYDPESARKPHAL